MQPWFNQPADENEIIYVVMDICHILKLVRNIGHAEIIIDSAGGKIQGSYFGQLHKLHDDGLHLGNKLHSSHILWEYQEMKVNLAAQTISASVADGFEFCRQDIRLPVSRLCCHCQI